MEKQELMELRGKVIENRERLRILNHQYNEMLNLKRSDNKVKNNDAEVIRKSKPYKIMKLVHILISLTMGTLLVSDMIPIMVLLLYMLITPFIGATFEIFVLPKIVFGKDYKVLDVKEKVEFNQEAADELYDEVSMVREEYHRLRHEFEEKMINNGLTDSPEYQEYLRIVDGIIEASESESQGNKEIPEEKGKELNLQ